MTGFYKHWTTKYFFQVIPFSHQLCCELSLILKIASDVLHLVREFFKYLKKIFLNP